MEEYFFQCPFCFTEVSILVDLSIAQQDYIEDCERCCNPLEFRISSDGETITDFQIEGLDQ